MIFQFILGGFYDVINDPKFFYAVFESNDQEILSIQIIEVQTASFVEIIREIIVFKSTLVKRGLIRGL